MKISRDVMRGHRDKLEGWLRVIWSSMLTDDGLGLAGYPIPALAEGRQIIRTNNAFNWLAGSELSLFSHKNITFKNEMKGFRIWTGG